MSQTSRPLSEGKEMMSVSIVLERPDTMRYRSESMLISSSSENKPASLVASLLHLLSKHKSSIFHFLFFFLHQCRNVVWEGRRHVGSMLVHSEHTDSDPFASLSRFQLWWIWHQENICCDAVSHYYVTCMNCAITFLLIFLQCVREWSSTNPLCLCTPFESSRWKADSQICCMKKELMSARATK